MHAQFTIFPILLFMMLQLIVRNEYIAATITPTSNIISQYTSYTIVIYRNNNPITSQFISPVSTVPTTAYVELDMPAAYTQISNVTNPQCFLSATSVPLSCTVNQASNNIIINNLFNSSSTQTAQILSITINNIKNPSRAESSGNFQYYIKRSNGTIIDQSPSATSGLYDTSIIFLPAAFSSCAISANNNYISTRSRLTFTIKTTNAIPQSGQLIIDVPLTWSGDLDQSNTIVSAPTCTPNSGISSVSCNYTTLNPPISIARVTVTLTATGVAANSQFILDVSSILTPPFTNYVLPVSIYSQWSDGVKIDTCTSNIANTIPIPFRQISFNVQSGSTVVQSKFTAKLDLNLAKSFSSQDQIALFLPNNFLTNNQISITSTNYAIFSTTVQSSTTSNTTTKVILSNFPAAPSVLPANNIFTFFLTNITNYVSTQAQTINVIFYRQSEPYQSSSTSYSSTIGTLTNFGIVSDSVVVNYVGVSLLSITSQFAITPGSYLEVIYNSAISAPDKPSTAVSSAALNGVRVSNVTYSVSQSVMAVSNIFQTQFVNGLIQVRIPELINPPTVRPTPYTLTIKTSTNYAIASSVYTYTAALQAFRSGSANLTASSYMVMNTGVVYSLRFETYYGFKSLSILIPPEVSTNVGFETTCTPNTYTSCSITSASISGYKNLTFIGTTVAGVQNISWGSNINPNSFKPTSSFELFTYSDGWGVEKSTGYIILTMTQQASLLSAQVIPSSLKNNDLITMQIDYILPALSPNGTVAFTMPDVIDISGASCSGLSLGTCSIIPPRVSIPFNNLNSSIAHSFALTLMNVRNAPSFKPIPNINMTLVSSDNYPSLSASIATWTNIQLSTFSTSVSSDVGYRGENALFTFNILGLSGKQTYINIKINVNFGQLTTAPLGSTLISGYEVRYSIPGEGTSQQSFTLQTPIYIGDYTFTLRTYTSDEYFVGESVSNVWQHSCYGTECRACSGLSCINCYNSSLSQYYIFNTANSSCIRACSQGFYLQSSTNNCIPCSTNCLECVNSSTTCTKCPIYTNTTPSTVYYLNTIFKTCVINCSTTYYPNTINQQCSPCVQPCYTCTNDNLCKTCVNGYYLLASSSSCLLTCPVNIMVPNNINKTCDFCDANCLTCSIFAYNCTSCNNTKLLYLEGNTCVTNCSSQKFLKNNICTQCQSPCRICYNSTTTCSQCFPNSTLPLWYDYKCISISECAIGHFVNSANGSCDLCPSQCQSCISLTNCSNCATGYYLYANTCIATCPNVTYKNNSTLVCDPCVGCLTCTSATVCTSCRTVEYYYLSTCKSICPSGTFPTTQLTTGNVTRAICATCPTDCPTCLNSSYCLTCLPQQYLYNGVCYINCPVSTFSNSPNCTNCPVTCRTCTSLTNCLTCATNYSLQNSRCVLRCSLGISYNQVCYPCGLNCAECVNTTCLRCAPYYYLLNNVCMSQCSASTLTLDNMTCVPCTNKFVNCTTCNQTHCLSCIEGELTNGQCLPCVPGYYTLNSKCVVCPYSCSICTNPNYCTSCKNNFYLQAYFCVDTCPNNKIPNGTKCDICTPNCSKCNLQTSLCSICVGGMYQFEGICLQSCPDPYVVNLNYTLCVTRQQYSQEYSKASKPIYFPFSIAIAITVLISILLKCYVKTMHLATFLVSIVSWIELACWVLFGVIQYLFYSNQQTNALRGVILVVAALATLVITNFIFLRFYFKYFVNDTEFEKWYRRHYCVSTVFVVLGTIFSFKAHRIIYSKVMDRDELSLVLSSAKKLIPISILSLISILVSSAPIIIGSCFAIYYSLNQDQQFFNALDTLTTTGIMILLLLFDLKHFPNYFIDQHETQNIRNKMYYEDYQSFSINNKISDKFKAEDFEKGSNQSRENLVDAADSSNMLDNMTTAKKIRVNKSSTEKIEGTQLGQTLRQNDKMKLQSDQLPFGEGTKNPLVSPEKEYKEEEIDEQEEQKPELSNKWVEKRYDHHGYLIKYDQKNDIIRFDKNGNRIQIDENGEHKKYDSDGYLVKQDPQTGQITRYDSDGLIVGKDGQRFDDRGYRVQKIVDSNGGKSFKYYDENGYEVIKDKETNEQIKLDSKGNKVVIDPVTSEHKSYNKQGYQIIYGKSQEQNKYKNEAGQYVRYNQKKKKWEEYDPEDGFLLLKNQSTDQYEKFDEYGFRIEKDQYGNLYRYDRDGNRIILSPNGTFRRFDKEGYEIKRDPLTGEEHRYDNDGYEVKVNPETGQKVFYNSDGYRVERDFYGQVTLYDEEGNLVIIDPVTKKHRKINKEGLEIIDDGKGGRYLQDKRGKKVVELQNGFYEKYDKDGNLIWLDEEGYEVETDEQGNICKYDKAGDQVFDDEIEENNEQNGGWEMQEDKGDSSVPAQNVNKKEKKNSNKFKVKKQYNHEEQYNKMIQQSKPHLIFDFEEEEEEEHLKQFHDVQPVPQYQLQKQYQTLYDAEGERQLIKRQQSQGNLRIKLEQLEQNDYTPYKNLRQKIKHNKNKSLLSKNEDEDLNDELMIEPEENQEKHEIKSVADVSIDERSFVNEGVKPITEQSRHEDEDLQSIEEINAIANMSKNKTTKNRRSEANFDKSSQVGGTKSENNYLQNNSKQSDKKEQVRKIFDSDEEVQSLQEEVWQNQGVDIFYKQNNSNYKTNTHEKGGQLQDQSDILSDYIPQQPIEDHHHKASQQNLLQRRYMQSIEEVEDELFEKLKSQDNRVKRSDFKLSGTPNPLVEYAKTIDVKKINEEKGKSKDRYGESKNLVKRR